jgi:sialidase-1
MAPNSSINIVLAKATEPEPRCQAGTILPFEDGRLLLAYSHFYDRSAKDDGPARIAGRWSPDEGNSWSAPFVLQENIGRLNCMTPSLLRMPSGRILLEFMRKDAVDDNYAADLPRGDYKGLLFPMVKHSDDEGQTWSEPHEITQGNDYWCTCHDRLFLTSRGRALLPMVTKAGAFCWLSDDDGQTWRMGKGPVPLHPEATGYAEPIIAETKDNKLKMWIRNKGKRFHVALSEDDGDSWQLHSDWGPNMRNAPCMVRRIPDTGDLLIIWNNNQIRTPLSCAISTDDGETWKHIKDIEPMTQWPTRCIHSYPSLAFHNGNAHITYYESKRHANPDDMVHFGAMLSLKYRRMPVEWFYES